MLWLCNPVYPHTYTQVLTLQFCTELTFISIKPFSLEFFGMVLLKAILHISLKGGLLFKLHVKFSGWCVHCLGRAGGDSSVHFWSLCLHFDASDGIGRQNRILVGSGSDSEHVCANQRTTSFHVHGDRFNSIARSRLHETRVGNLLHLVSAVGAYL